MAEIKAGALRAKLGYFSVSDLARKLNKWPQCVNRWIQEGLIEPPTREFSNHQRRYYNQADVDRILGWLQQN